MEAFSYHKLLVAGMINVYYIQRKVLFIIILTLKYIFFKMKIIIYSGVNRKSKRI